MHSISKLYGVKICVQSDALDEIESEMQRMHRKFQRVFLHWNESIYKINAKFCCFVANSIHNIYHNRALGRILSLPLIRNMQQSGKGKLNMLLLFDLFALFAIRFCLLKYCDRSNKILPQNLVLHIFRPSIFERHF